MRSVGYFSVVLRNRGIKAKTECCTSVEGERWYTRTQRDGERERKKPGIYPANETVNP